MFRRCQCFPAIIACAATLFAVGCGGKAETTGGSATARPAAGPIKIGAVLPMFSHPFFVAQKQGLETAAKELGISIDIRDGQDDDLKQISQVEALLNSGIQALILCPRDETALLPAVKAANRLNVPVITLNRRIKGGKVVCHVGADDADGGKAQGKALVEALGGRGGKVVYLQGTRGSSPQISRNEGLQAILKDHPEIEIADDRYTNFQEDQAKAVMTELVRRFPPGRIQAIVAQADELAVPAAGVAAAEGWKDVLVIGFNGNTSAFQAIKQGRLFATVLQDPVEQGRKAVETTVAHLKGTLPPGDVITPLPLVTKSNIDKYQAAY